MNITIIFPHQLFAEHPAIQSNRSIALIEDPLYFGTDPKWPQQVHRQKLLLHRASMQVYAERLRSKGFKVILQRHHQATDTAEHLELLWEIGYRSFHLADPVDDLIEKRVRRTIERIGGKITFHPTPMFITPKSVIDDHFDNKKKPNMASFYTMQRRRLNLLLDCHGAPLGGRWSLDADNRKKLPKGIVVPVEPGQNITSLLLQLSQQLESEDLPGIGRADHFNYPITHEDAERWLDDFLVHRLKQFGTYEDAISCQHRVMWHGVLTPMLNCGLLTPQQVLNRTLDRAQEGDVPLNSLEGFIRQIVGWREFMAVMYERHGIVMRNSNYWKFASQPIPNAFYSASTGIPPIDDAIRHALDHGWCHHIERLMLIGNIMLLCEYHPDQVYRWFMELFVDAYDWVMVPNVYGMSQFADGGIFTTKPYLSGSNYVRKMSDYRKGDWCDIWDGLFWSFIKRHEKVFRSQARLAMMSRHLDRMSETTLCGHQRRAVTFLDGLA